MVYVEENVTNHVVKAAQLTVAFVILYKICMMNILRMKIQCINNVILVKTNLHYCSTHLSCKQQQFIQSSQVFVFSCNLFFLLFNLLFFKYFIYSPTHLVFPETHWPYRNSVEQTSHVDVKLDFTYLFMSCSSKCILDNIYNRVLFNI